jgi:hypothetical protein
VLRVDAGRANQLTWDRVIAEVHDAHAATVKLGSVLAPPLITVGAVLGESTALSPLPLIES